MKKYLLLVLLCLACGKAPSSAKDTDTLGVQYNNHLSAFSWSPSDCDSALWAGLAVRGGADIKLSEYLNADGRPLRLPGRDCLPPDSASTTSNDMLTGLVVGFLYQRDLDALERLWDYGEQHHWVMGSGPLTRTYWKPNGVTELARAIYHLGGADHWQRLRPIVYGPAEDYESHLQIISLLIQHDVDSKPVVGEDIVCNNAADGDAFALAVCGDKNQSSRLLEGDYQYPSYVRGDEKYKDIHWLVATKVTLE